MATIAGVDVGVFGNPISPAREENVSIGQASDGSFKFAKLREADVLVTIPLHSKTITVINSLISALEADADRIVTIAPDAWVSVGGATAGTSITAQWIDPRVNAVWVNNNAYDVTLNFIRVT